MTQETIIESMTVIARSQLVELASDYMCQVCGIVPVMNEPIIKLEFSLYDTYCQEYPCGIKICDRCLSMMSAKLKEFNKTNQTGLTRDVVILPGPID